jgi:hypothetical protein
LVFNEDKTRIVHLATGFDFLGFSVRRYGATLLIKPSKAAIQRIRERLRTEMRALRGSNAAAVLAALTPIIRGWAAYYRGVVSSRTFKSLDNYLWTLTYKWATRGHPNKPKTWVCARYFGKFNKFRRVIHCSELTKYSTILARRVDISDGPLRERIGFADSTSRERTVTCTIPPACTRTRFSMCAR